MSYFLYLWFALVNRLSKKSLVDPQADFDVSLTSHADRVLRLHGAIESLCAGSVKPRRIILYLAAEDWPRPLPKTVQRLVGRGLEVIDCPNFGPHKKQQPYLQQQSTFRYPLITVDDDVYYDSDLLQRLVAAWRERPAEIHCSRARRIQFRGEEFAPYKSWPLCTGTEASHLNFATGVGGVLYPPAFLEFLKQAGDGFQHLCPMADDIWMHVNETRAGYPVRQVAPVASYFPDIPGSRRTALFKKNIRGDHNDHQLKAVYTAADLARLLTPSAGAHALAAQSQEQPVFS